MLTETTSQGSRRVPWEILRHQSQEGPKGDGRNPERSSDLCFNVTQNLPLSYHSRSPPSASTR